MRRIFLIFVCCLVIQGAGFSQDVVKLPSPSYKGEVSLEEALFKRRSVRRYKDEALTLKELGQLLWSCAGKSIDGLSGPTRAAPSAGGIYPIDIYVIAGDVEGLLTGIYKYGYRDHLLTSVKEGDFRKALRAACWDQPMVEKAPVSFVFVGFYDKVAKIYHTRGERLYLPLDIGAACENLHLQAESLGLGTVMLGAFSDDDVKKIIDLKRDLKTMRPFCIMPVGKK